MPRSDGNWRETGITPEEREYMLAQLDGAYQKALDEDARIDRIAKGLSMTTVAEPTTNGRQRGRAAPLPTFTFPDSGITVALRRLAPDTQQHIARAVEGDAEWGAAHPKPEPPLQPVTDLEGKEELVPNPEEPGYKERLSAYITAFHIEVGERLIAIALRQIVVEVDEEAVKTLRDDLAAIGAPIADDVSAEDIYIRRICISSVFDIQALLAYVQGHSGPTEAAIARHRATFSG